MLISVVTYEELTIISSMENYAAVAMPSMSLS